MAKHLPELELYERLSKLKPYTTMFEKHIKLGPVQELNVETYRVTILVVLLSPKGSVRMLRELFQGVAMFSESDY